MIVNRNFLLGLLAAFGTASADIPFFADTFNRADEAITADADWVRIGAAGGGELGIVSNQIQQITSPSGRRTFLSPDSTFSDGYVQSGVPNLTGRGSNTANQLTARFVDTDNYLAIWVTQANVPGCGKRTADVFSTFGAGTPDANVIGLRMEFEGTTIRCYFHDGDGYELFETETGVTDHLTATRTGYTINVSALGVIIWDDYNVGRLGAELHGADKIIFDRFTGDPFAAGVTYYFNSARSGTSNGTGVSDANAFYTASHLRNKNFAVSDQLLFKDDQATTVNANLTLDDSRGTTSDPFYIGAYHLVSGSPVRGLSTNTPVNTPDHLGYPCIDGHPWATYDYYGGMTNTQLMAMEPEPDETSPGSGIYLEGTNNGLLQIQGSGNYELNLIVEDLCIRASGGKGIAMIQAINAHAMGLLLNRVIVDGVMKQSIHMGGVYEAIVQNSILTRADGEQIYAPGAGNLQGQLTTKGTQGDPDTPSKVVFRRNLIFDSHSSECMNSNSGTSAVIIEDNICIDSGKVVGIYPDRTRDMVVQRNIVIRTGRTAWHDFEGTTTDGRGGTGVQVQNESACGSFNWCTQYDTEADWNTYKSQHQVIAYNIVIGYKFSYGFLSQASTAVGAPHLGRPHGPGIYFYNNMSLDPAAIHFSDSTASPVENYILDSTYPQRVWGNIWWNGDTQFGDNSLADRNDVDFQTPVTNHNYASADMPVQSNFDENLVRTGLDMPLSDYWDLSGQMSFDANGHMSIQQALDFVQWMGVNPTNLAEKNLIRFRPLTNASSSIAAGAMTMPPLMVFGYLDEMDIENNPWPATMPMGPFATTQSAPPANSLPVLRYYRRILGD